jgi:hypothetical protein
VYCGNAIPCEREAEAKEEFFMRANPQASPGGAKRWQGAVFIAPAT